MRILAIFNIEKYLIKIFGKYSKLHKMCANLMKNDGIVMKPIYFIADLHLSETHPELTALLT